MADTGSAGDSSCGSQQPSHAPALLERIARRDAVIGVIGLGYVGLPLVRAAHAAGYNVVGYDTDPAKIEKLTRGEAYLRHLGEELAPTLAASDRFEATSDARRLASADVIILCVPTPLGPHREPDLQCVLASTHMVAEHLKPGRLIILESTTYPGTTREEMLPILEARGLKCDRDFFLAHSPEREDPGRTDMTTQSIPKLVGGVDAVSGDLAEAFYSSAFTTVHRVSTAEVAEAAKLLENIFRAVNIAMVNELKTILTDMDIDVWEVIAAASTKPFGFMPFYPGPGLGGHCIPIDPFYLAWKAKEIGRPTKFIELAGEINQQMPRYVIHRLMEAMNIEGKTLKGSKVLLIGVAYKPNIDDIRESPAAEIIELLRDAGTAVSYHDPHVPTFPPMRRYQIDLASIPLDESTIREHDVVLIVTDHDAVDYELIGRDATLVVDTRNAMARVAKPNARVVKA